MRAGLCQRAKPATIAAHRGVKEPPAVTITARSRTSLPHRIVTEGSNNTASNLAANRKDQHCQLNTPCAYFRYVGPLRYVGAQAAQAHGSPALQPSAKPMIQHTWCKCKKTAPSSPQSPTMPATGSLQPQSEMYTARPSHTSMPTSS